jgi:hypothetical protein
MAIYTTELLTDRDYNIPEGRLPLEYAVDTANKAKTHSENAEVHVTAEDKTAWNAIAAVKNAQNVSLGYNSKSLGSQSVAVGVDVAAVEDYASAFGRGARCSSFGGIAIGSGNASGLVSAMAIGSGAVASKSFSVAFGYEAASKDKGVVAIAAWGGNPDSAHGGNIQTTLYLIGQNSPLSNTYEDGEACLGYLVKDTSGNVLASGTRKLSELLTSNTTFAPASLDPEAEPPKVFLPTGATDPIEDLELTPDMEQPQEQA